MKNKLLAIAAAVILLAGVASPAQAAEPELHPDVEYAIDAVPGGIVVDETTVVWPALGMVLTAASDMSRSVGTCGTGNYCAYAGPGRTGTKISFGICTVVSTSALASVGSIANARSSGSVQARNAAGTILGTAAAGTGVDVGAGTSTLRCNL